MFTFHCICPKPPAIPAHLRGISTCLYAVLGVAPVATDFQIRAAYRRNALRWHPDKNQDILAESERRFKDIQRAYSILSDPQERAYYDDNRVRILASCSRPNINRSAAPNFKSPEKAAAPKPSQRPNPSHTKAPNPPTPKPAPQSAWWRQPPSAASTQKETKQHSTAKGRIKSAFDILMRRGAQELPHPPRPGPTVKSAFDVLMRRGVES